MKDYKELYLKTFFFWQEAYGKLRKRYEELLKELEELKKTMEKSYD